MSEVLKHYRVTIQVQEVTPAQPIERGARLVERRVHELVNLSIAADTEREAYAKALRALGMLAPPAGYVETDR